MVGRSRYSRAQAAGEYLPASPSQTCRCASTGGPSERAHRAEIDRTDSIARPVAPSLPPPRQCPAESPESLFGSVLNPFFDSIGHSRGFVLCPMSALLPKAAMDADIGFGSDVPARTHAL